MDCPECGTWIELEDNDQGFVCSCGYEEYFPNYYSNNNDDREE